MITGVFVSPDGRDVAVVYDDGEGGIAVLPGGTWSVDDLDSVPDDWRRWEPAPVDDVEGVDLAESVPVYEHDHGYEDAAGGL